MILTTVLFTGWFALQEPVKPPQDPPRPPEATRDATKRDMQVDADLRAALDEFTRSSGYRFEIEATMEGGAKRPLAGGDDVSLLDSQRDEKGDHAGQSDAKVAHAKEHSGKRESVRVNGAFQREKPAHLETDHVEAYRSNELLAWRGRDQKEWATLPARVGEPPRDAADVDDVRVATLLSRLPLPEDVIRDLDVRLVSCQRAIGDAKTGMATYECVVAPIASKDLHRPEAALGDAKSGGRNCALRFIVTQGRIVEIDWRHPAMAAAKIPASPTGAAEDPAGPSITCKYTLSDVGSAQVTVPEDVTRVLGER